MVAFFLLSTIVWSCGVSVVCENKCFSKVHVAMFCFCCKTIKLGLCRVGNCLSHELTELLTVESSNVGILLSSQLSQL